VALMTDATRFLVHELSYELPEQDLTLNWSGLPALPRSGMVLGAVRLAA
jgi:fatty-acid peroxygenase